MSGCGASLNCTFFSEYSPSFFASPPSCTYMQSILRLMNVFFSLFQACAPRYVYYVFMGRMDPVGMCFSARKNFSQIRAHRPCVESGRSFFTWTNFSNIFFLFFSPPQKPYQFLNLVLNIIAMSSTDVSVRLSQKLFVYKRQQTLKL